MNFGTGKLFMEFYKNYLVETNNKLFEYSQKIDELTNYVNSKIVIINKQRDNQPEAFFYTLALKTNNGLNTANLFIANLVSRPHCTDSLLLLLRTMLSDAITFYYIVAKSRNNNDDVYLKELIMEIEGDHIKFMDKNFNIYKKLYNETDKKVGLMQKEFKKMYSQYFNTDGSYKYSAPSVTQMVVVIIDSGDAHLRDNVATTFELYDTFSKYEHLGVLTTHLVTRQFDEQHRQKIFQEVYVAVHNILLVLGSLLLRFLSVEEMDHYEKIEKEIHEIKIYK